MPLYHFNVLDGVNIPDDAGVHLPNLHAARLEAVRYSGELLRDHPDAFWVQSEWRIEVTDLNGLILFAIHISAVEAPSLHGWRPDTRRPSQPD